MAISVTIFACYRSADRIGRVLGERGINVLTQLSAFIMLCIGIQIFWDGVSQLIHP
ncbi:MAG: MarC family protein [Acetobacteraceae bacterium]